MKRMFRYFLFLFLFGFLGMLLLGIKMFTGVEEEDPIDNGFPMVFDDREDHRPLDEEMDADHTDPDINKPIILWWTPFTGEEGTYKQCGNVKCFFTVKRAYRSHPMTKVFMFYGTDFKLSDLPLPRQPHHEWALLHEESPKNNYLFSHAEIMTLFNMTSTFKRESSYPITTQYLVGIDWLESSKYLLPTKEKTAQQKELAPIMYAHSDCDVPSDRDHYVEMLQKYIKIDSYGSCLHNKDLPEHLKDPIQGMDHKDFHELVGKYKFSLAMENGICDDYITEKLWRPLMAGSVPIVLGSPKVKDFLPSDHAAIIIDDFNNVEELGKYLNYLNRNDAEYEKYLQWKKEGVSNNILKESVKKREWVVESEENWSPTTINFIDGFECYVCKAVHENMRRTAKGDKPLQHTVTVDHYGCPAPEKFDEDGRRSQNVKENEMWRWDWFYHGQLARAAREFIDQNKTFTVNDLKQKMKTNER